MVNNSPKTSVNVAGGIGSKNTKSFALGASSPIPPKSPPTVLPEGKYGETIIDGGNNVSKDNSIATSDIPNLRMTYVPPSGDTPASTYIPPPPNGSIDNLFAGRDFPSSIGQVDETNEQMDLDFHESMELRAARQMRLTDREETDRAVERLVPTKINPVPIEANVVDPGSLGYVFDQLNWKNVTPNIKHTNNSTVDRFNRVVFYRDQEKNRRSQLLMKNRGEKIATSSFLDKNHSSNKGLHLHHASDEHFMHSGLACGAAVTNFADRSKLANSFLDGVFRYFSSNDVRRNDFIVEVTKLMNLPPHFEADEYQGVPLISVGEG